MIILKEQNVYDNITIRDSIRTKVSTAKFLSVTLDENLTFNDHVNKVTTKISKSVAVMRRLHCQLPADVMVKLIVVFFGVFPSDLCYTGIRRSGRTNTDKIECAHRRARTLLTDFNYKIPTFHSIYDYFAF